MRTNWLRPLVGLGLVCTLLTGCSTFFVHGPPDNWETRQDPFSCTESYALPIVDLTVGIPATALGLWLSIDSISTYPNSYTVQQLAGDLMWTNGLWATFAGAFDISTVKNCREAQAKYERRMEKQRKAEAETEQTDIPERTSVGSTTVGDDRSRRQRESESARRMGDRRDRRPRNRRRETEGRNHRADDPGRSGPSRSKRSEGSAEKGDKTLTIVQSADLCGVDPGVIRDAVASEELSAVDTGEGYILARREVRSYCREKGYLGGGGESAEEGPEKKPIYTLSEAAELCDVPKGVVRDWIESGELNAVETSEGYRISRQELQETWREMGGGDLFE